ncbi:MAG: restriction endonuclease subunit S [Candidatus Electrothrix communis]|nr:MAG: restriction endonuclease subunit S [Candidatus Electrothrix communis]
MRVPEGFKQTEVGVIPDDWEVETISEIASVKTGPFGSLLHEKDYVSSGTPIITVEHLGEHGITSENTPNVSDSDKSRLKEYILRKHDIVFSRVGSIDRSALVGDYETGWLFSGRLLRVRAITRRAKPTYLNYHFKSESFRKKIYSVAVGQTMASLNTEILKRVKVPLPTPAEQTAIATALNDMDTLIEGVEKLLEKKRRIKQGAMQELLRPKDGWVAKELGSTATLKARIGWQGLTTSEYKKTGEYYLITGTEFKNGFINWDKCHYVEHDRYKQDKNIQVKKHDVLVTKDGTIGKVALIKSVPKPATLNSGVFVIRPVNNSFHPEFFYYILLSDVFLEFLRQLSAGSTINHLYQKDFVSFKFFTPTIIEEQKKIAAVLSDMDTEIEQLETQLTKYRQLKTGMMQELLTGKKRLV